MKIKPQPAKPAKETQAAAAVRLSDALEIVVTRQMVRSWKAKGYDINDPVALNRALWNQETRPKGLKRPAGDPTEEAESPASELDLANVERELASLHGKLVKAKDYEEARTLRTQIAGIRDVLKELREQGRYILREDATKAAATAALASRGQWEKIEDSLPPMLEGLTALQMKEKLRDYARAVSMELASVFE